jgi:flagellar biosynthesis component FlhA
MEFIRTASDAKLLIIAAVLLVLSLPALLISFEVAVTVAIAAICYAVVAWIAKGWDF